MELARIRRARILLVLSIVVILTASFAVAPTHAGPVTSRNATSGIRSAVTPPTPPPEFNCIGYGASLLIVAPTYPPAPGAGIAGTVFELEGSGYYNRTSGPLGSFTIWMANYSGGSLLYLTMIPAGVPVHFFVNVTVPSRNTTAPFTAGAYEFWSLENYTTTPTCANYPFTLTATPPPSIGCLSWTAQLRVTSPVPANGAAGTPVGLQGRAFSPTGDTTIYWANATGSPYANVGTTSTSDPQGWFNTTIDVPSGYAAGLYTFWAIDGDSDCAGAPFNLTGVPSSAVPPPSSSPTGFLGLPGSDGYILLGGLAAALVVIILLLAARRHKLPIVFTEIGLPAGTRWSVVLDGTEMSATVNVIMFTVHKGTHSYRVGSPLGFVPSPVTGTVELKGERIDVKVKFSSPGPKT